jgi:hypothetical protein
MGMFGFGIHKVEKKITKSTFYLIFFLNFF